MRSFDPPLFPSSYESGMGANAKDKLQNYVTNLGEKRTSVAMGLAIKPN